MRVSQYFRLNRSQFELDFIDIPLNTDIPLFIDPYYLGKCNFEWAIDAHRTLHDFFQVLLVFLQSNQVEEAFSHFSHLSEPNETHLGLSIGRPQGRGIGVGDTEKIFRGLIRSKAVQSGVVEDIEDFRLFVNGIDKDKISDIATNIIKRHLIEYTQQQCGLWEIPLQQDVPSGFLWNRHTHSWENGYTKLPVADNQKILLVPKRIVTYSTEYTQEKYTRHFVLNFLQAENLRKGSPLVQVRKNRKGEITKRFVTKKSIIEDIGDITKEYLIDFTKRHPDVFHDFKAKIQERIKVIGNADLTDVKISDVISHLIEVLRNIAPGNEQAKLYHRTIVSILELLFYPRLTSPQVEREIHEGRKRIDITFDNSAETGFFFRLPSVKRINSQYILIECKNYSRDVVNPELDQITGRFSPNRGQFGIIVCRSIDDMPTLLQRCRDAYKDQRGFILPLVDSDIVSMLTNFQKYGINYCEDALDERFRMIALD